MIHDSHQSFEEHCPFLVASYKALSITVDDCLKNWDLGSLINAFEVVRNADEFLQFTKISCLDFFQRWPELQFLLSVVIKRSILFWLVIIFKNFQLLLFLESITNNNHTDDNTKQNMKGNQLSQHVSPECQTDSCIKGKAVISKVLVSN